MVDYPPERIAGPRLVLRPPMLDDAGAMFQRVARDPEVTKYLLWTPHPDVAATRRVIAERLNVEEHARTWVITLQHSDDVIGMTSGRRSVRHSVEIGYCVGRRWWGKGLMSEVLDMLLDHAGRRSGRLPRMGHLPCRQRAVGGSAAASRVPPRGSAHPARRLSQPRARTTRQLALRQGAAVTKCSRVFGNRPHDAVADSRPRSSRRHPRAARTPGTRNRPRPSPRFAGPPSVSARASVNTDNPRSGLYPWISLTSSWARKYRICLETT